MSFQFPFLAILLISIPLLLILFYFLLRWKKNTALKMGDPVLIRELIRDHSPSRFRIKFMLIILALTAGILAAMNPRTAGRGENTNRSGMDVVIALDVSKSMLAPDPAPARFKLASVFIKDLMEKMPDSRFALVVFAGRAYLQMPLTTDHQAINLFVSSIQPGSLPAPGTAISEALKVGALAFDRQQRRFQTMVLITDGEDQEENAMETVEEIAAQGIMVNTVGIGSATGSSFTDPATGSLKKDESGNIVITRLHEPLLQQIARNCSGVYVNLGKEPTAMETVLTRLDMVEKKQFRQLAVLGYRSEYSWFALAMLLLILIEFALPERIKRKQ